MEQKPDSTSKRLDQILWLLIQGAVFSIPIDSVIPIPQLRMTVCELLFSAGFFVWVARVGYKRVVPKFDDLFLVLIAFLIAATISIVQAQNTFIAVREIMQFLWMLAIGIMVADVLSNSAQVAQLILLMAVSASASSLVGLWQYFFHREPVDFLIAQTRVRATGFYAQPNPFGSFLIGLIPLVCAVMYALKRFDQENSRNATKASLEIALLLTSLAVAATFSRGSWVGLVVGLLLFFALLRRHVRWSAARLSVAIVCLGFVVIIADYSFQPETTSRTFSSKQRTLLLKTAVAMWRDHPIVGVGLGNFPVRLLEYADDSLKATLYWDYDKVKKDYFVNPKKKPDVELVHNMPLQVATESGILGVISFAVLLFLYARRAWMKLKDTSDFFVFFLRAGSLASVTAILTAGLFGWPFTHGVQELLLFGIALTLCPLQTAS